MRPSSASAPTWRDCWPSTASSHEPLLALLVSGLAAMLLGFVTSFLVLRGSDLTRIMVTLGVALVLRELANRYAWLTGGADGLQGVEIKPLLGLFRFDMFGHTAYAYSLAVLFVMFLLARRIVNSPFGLSLLSIKGNPLRAAAVGIPVNRRLVAVYTIAAGYAGVAGRAADADDGVRLARRVRLRPLGRSAAGADHRRHRLSVRRPDRRAPVQADAGLHVGADAAILAVLDRPAAGGHRAGRPRADQLVDGTDPGAGRAPRLARARTTRRRHRRCAR